MEKTVGYSQGDMEPAEFDVTKFGKPGENEIAVQVLRYSEDTYLENQDMWHWISPSIKMPVLEVKGMFVHDVFFDMIRIVFYPTAS